MPGPAKRPGFKVGEVEVANPLLLAPMEDVTNLAFRLIAKRIAGPGLMFTEFVSAMAVHHNAKKTVKKMRVLEQERPLGIQIFGGDPDIMAATAQTASWTSTWAAGCPRCAAPVLAPPCSKTPISRPRSSPAWSAPSGSP
jgi:tRNA-dihydrouridine synthase